MCKTAIRMDPDMQKNPYRKAWKNLLLIFLASLGLIVNSCNDEQVTSLPRIEFINSPGYLDHDTVLSIGDRVIIGVNAFATGRNITFFQVTFDDGTRQILLDSGLNSPDLNYTLAVIKSASAFENWTFLVMDRDRNKDSVRISLNKSDSSHYGNIRTYSDITLGAQENTVDGSFFSFTNGEIYSLDTAFLKQEMVDLVYYFGQYEATLSSPNETEAPDYFTGPAGIANWTIKNETRYDTTALAPREFDASVNDSLILAVYEPTAGKRKVKFVEPGMVISFKSPAGKIGLLKIIATDPGPAGTLLFSIKIQE
jgi:hypothetical protein